MTQGLSHTGSRKVEARPPSGWVIRERRGKAIGTPVDWSRWYVTDEEDMGESPEQEDLIELLKACLKELASERGWSDVRIGSDAFFAWVPKHPLVRVSPDIYVLDNPPPRKKLPKSWQTWRPGVNPPRFALEIVSVSWKKDYVDAPERYAQLGCRELVIFDPKAARRGLRSPRQPLTVYRRRDDGAFELVESGAGPLWSAELNAALVIQKGEDGVALRLARDAAGRDLVPTTAERAAAEALHAAAAEKEVAQLKAELARLTRRDGSK